MDDPTQEQQNPINQYPQPQTGEVEQSSLPTQVTSNQQIITKQVNTKSKKPLIIIALLIVILAISGVTFGILTRNREKVDSKSKDVPLLTSKIPPSPTPESFIRTETINLVDRTGGSSTGMVTRTRTLTYHKHQISAQLPDLEVGQYYFVWMGESPDSLFQIGELIKNENNYVLEDLYEYAQPYISSEFLPALNLLVVSLETSDDQIIENTILEGNFNPI